MNHDEFHALMGPRGPSETMSPPGHLAMRAISRKVNYAIAPSENSYSTSLRSIFGGLHEGFVEALLAHAQLGSFRKVADAEDDEPEPGLMHLGTAAAGVEVRFLAQVPHKVGTAFDRMSPGLVQANHEVARYTMHGISSSDMGITEAIHTARLSNIALVSKAARAYSQDVMDVFSDPANYDLSVPALRKLLMARGNVSLARADLIARDQVLKLTGQMNMIRQVNAGVESYVWSGVMDRRERESHRRLEGNVYRWDQETPIRYRPGQDYQCRCVAIAWV